MKVWVPGYFATDGASCAVPATVVSFLARTGMRGDQVTETNNTSLVAPPPAIYMPICSSSTHKIKNFLNVI
jgi:hypothetical protein